jgi:UDP-3-O-[3-hydroxymyristoyl] N-acetylglucosamine deacetylase
VRVRRPFEIRDGERRIRVEPSRSLKISYAIDFAHPSVGRQAIKSLVLSDGSFEREICRARTFGFLHEVEALWRSGLARGGSLDNTVVLDAQRVLNRDGLRWPDEFVRHKVLDLIGDLALVGRRIIGRVVADRAGHAMHTALVSRFLRDRSLWDEVTWDDVAQPAAVLA